MNRDLLQSLLRSARKRFTGAVRRIGLALVLLTTCTASPVDDPAAETDPPDRTAPTLTPAVIETSTPALLPEEPPRPGPHRQSAPAHRRRRGRLR